MIKFVLSNTNINNLLNVLDGSCITYFFHSFNQSKSVSCMDIKPHNYRNCFALSIFRLAMAT